MSLPVTICDDSKIARKMMAKSLPDAWDVEISFAENGEEAIENINNGKADILFLDLNMPVMDGYAVMEAVRAQDLPSMVIVVSGDIQPHARQKMLSLGALDFIEKPIDNEKLSEILRKFGIFCGETSTNKRQDDSTFTTGNSVDDKLDVLQELSNLAMGKAGKSLATLLDQFISLPVPRVSLLHRNELQMALSESANNEKISAVSKSFISQGIAGESIVMFDDKNAETITRLMGYTRQSENADVEALMDVGNIVIGTCLNAISSQLSVDFTYNSPSILGMHSDVSSIMSSGNQLLSDIVMIEIDYVIPEQELNFELLLLIPEKHVDNIFQRMLKQKTDEA